MGDYRRWHLTGGPGIRGASVGLHTGRDRDFQAATRAVTARPAAASAAPGPGSAYSNATVHHLGLPSHCDDREEGDGLGCYYGPVTGTVTGRAPVLCHGGHGWPVTFKRQAEGLECGGAHRGKILVVSQVGLQRRRAVMLDCRL